MIPHVLKVPLLFLRHWALLLKLSLFSQAHNNKFHADKKEKNKKYKKYVYDQISAQIEEAQKDDT